MTKKTDHMDAQECWNKASECREDAKRAIRSEYRIMLEHMAEVWERMAKSMESGH
jgi:hypothetical protein